MSQKYAAWRISRSSRNIRYCFRSRSTQAASSAKHFPTEEEELRPVIDKHDGGEISSTQERFTIDKEVDLSFNDCKQAFQSKTSLELLRGLLVLKLCSFDFLVDRSREMMKVGQMVLGQTLFEKVMKMTIYGHFVGGEDQEKIKPVIGRMNQFGVGAILDYSAEEDISEEQTVKAMGTEDADIVPSDVHGKYKAHKEFADRRQNVTSARTYFYEGEEKCDKNRDIFLKCIDAVAGATPDGYAAVKLTALGRPKLLLRLSEILNETQYFFDHLVGDISSHKLMDKKIAKDAFVLGLHQIGVELTTEESEQIFHRIDTGQNGVIDVLDWHEFLTPQLQLSRLFQASPTSKEGHPVISTLTTDELHEMNNLVDRCEEVAEHAEAKGVRVMVDAEQTYFQPAINRLTLKLMREFNTRTPRIFNTYQCYLKSAYNDVERDIELARREGFYFGAKLVRGAYMEQERLRAETLGYEDPINPTYEATSEMYNTVVNAVLEEVKRGTANVLVASHNEDSVRFTVRRMQELGLSKDDGSVSFGQLLGMCDQISFTLGEAGYKAFKYVPYGPVMEVIPYLSRRAVENRGLLKGVKKERKLLWEELQRRLREKVSFS